ncbi:hypothetical protein OF846_003291 [Rhodotorula toruloides]|nr:hypothetical protein OF846_003291 [Rhodotorula toruloides]
MRLSLLQQLPSELLNHLLSCLPLDSLLALSSTSRSFHELITSTALPRLARTTYGYSPRTIKHLGFHRNTSWVRRTLWARQVAKRWDNWDARGFIVGGPGREFKKCLPTMRMWEVERGVEVILVGKGRDLEMWLTRSDGGVDVVPVLIAPGRQLRKSGNIGGLEDVTSLARGTRPGEILVSRVSGRLQRLRVVQHPSRGSPLVLEETAQYSAETGAGRTGGGGLSGSTSIQAMHSEGPLLVAASTSRTPPSSRPATPAPAAKSTVSLAHTLKDLSSSSSHAVSLYSIAAPWQPPIVLPFMTRPWSVHVAPSKRWLAVGHSGTSPLSLIHLDSTGSPILPSTSLAHTPRSTAVYAVTTPPVDSCGFLSPEQTLLAAFYDSTTRIYDLRVPPPPSQVVSAWDQPRFERPSNEIMRLADPWSDDPAFSLAVGGTAGSYVAVGTARNAAIRLFDVRQAASGGITAFAPGRDRSPVYGLEMEGSRLWGVSEKRGFWLDFDAFLGKDDGERVPFVGHVKGEGGALRWMGE